MGIIVRCIRAVLAVVASIGLSSAASATSVTATQGDVLVNKGSGYTSVTGTTQVKPGDFVMVKPGGQASVVYLAGCVVVVQTGTVYTVQPENHCPLGPTNTDFTPYVVGAAVIGGGVAAGILLSQGNSKPASP